MILKMTGTRRNISGCFTVNTTGAGNQYFTKRQMPAGTYIAFGHWENSDLIYVEESGYVSTEISCNEKPQVCIIQNKGYHFLAGRDRYIGVTGPK